MILPTAIAMKREKIIMDHVLKCFTWGRKVRRDTPLEVNQVSKADDIRRKFNRVKLIRRYFSK